MPIREVLVKIMRDKKVFLVSALVEGSNRTGHRARVCISYTESEALGESLILFQKDGMNVVSFDVALCDTVIPNPDKIGEYKE